VKGDEVADVRVVLHEEDRPRRLATSRLVHLASVERSPG
jgi:hypothetical protein